MQQAQVRPCVIMRENGTRYHALFHRWVDKSWIVPPSPLVGGHSGGVMRATFALCEYDDGRIAEVPPSEVMFVDDNHIDRYDFKGW